MNIQNKKWWIVGGVVVIILLWGIGGYNSFVTMNTAIDGQWAQVEAQYQRRFDLIPNLMESVKGVMKQEQSIFTALADARTRYGGAQTVNDKVKAASEVEGALSRLLVVVERYPELKSSENMQTLMAQVEGTENRISVERMRFNDAVREMNTRVRRFPASVIASLFGFEVRAYFEAVQGSETAPEVNF